MREPTWVVGAVGCAGFILFGAAFVFTVFTEEVQIVPVGLAAAAFALFPLLAYRHAGTVGKVAHVAGLAAVVASLWPSADVAAWRSWAGWFAGVALVVGSVEFSVAAARLAERFDAVLWALAGGVVATAVVATAAGWEPGRGFVPFAVPFIWFVLGLRALDPERRVSRQAREA